MTVPTPVSTQTGHFIALRDYYLKAAAYDSAFARYADVLDRRDRGARATVTAVTAITSLGAFGSLFVDNPAWWAKVIVFALAATAAGLTALRQDSRWADMSTTMRAQGAKWTELRNTTRDWLAIVRDGGAITDDQLSEAARRDSELVQSNPSLSHHLYSDCKEERAREFDQAWHVT